MTPAAPMRRWPAVLFLAAAAWFVVASLLPVAVQAWRAVAVVAPFEPSFDAETARLFDETGIVVKVGQASEAGTAAVGRELVAATQPLRLDILFDPQQAGEVHLLATEPVSRGLGPQCLPDAIEPLLRREAAGGDQVYLASLGLEVVQAAYEADRFGRPMLPRWLLPGLASLCGALAWASRRFGRTPAPAGQYTPSPALTNKRRCLQADLIRIEANIVKAQASLAELDASVLPVVEPDWWQRLNVMKRAKERQDAERALAAKAALAAKLAGLVQSKAAAEAELSRNEQQFTSDRERFDLRLEDRAWRAGVSRRAFGVLATAAVALAATHATIAVALPGALISTAYRDEMLFRGDLLVATALDANPDLEAVVGARCFARVVRPDPQEAVVASAAEPAHAWSPIIDPPPPIHDQHCRIGIPCGRACIPAGRMCHIGQPTRIGQACGKGYIAMAKTCQVDRAPPPITPVVARPTDTGPHSSPASTFAYPTPSTTPSYVPPPPSVTDSASSTVSPPYHAVTPAPMTPMPSSPRTVHVDSYTKSNGTQVQSYDRTAPGQGSGRGGRR